MHAALTAITAFAVTNVDDIMVLMLLFARLNEEFRPVHVVVGQYLGITVLVLASLIGLVGKAVLPEAWIGLLGLLPIGLGVASVAGLLAPASGDQSPGSPDPESEGLPPGLSQVAIVGVAALTIANGSDNIGVYMPMFASASLPDLQITLLIFLLLTGCWCLLAWWLVNAPWLAAVMQRYASLVLPLFLVVSGLSILYKHHTFDSRALALLTLLILFVMVSCLLRQLNQWLPEGALSSRFTGGIF